MKLIRGFLPLETVLEFFSNRPRSSPELSIIQLVRDHDLRIGVCRTERDREMIENPDKADELLKDMMARKRTEEALARSERRFRALYELSTDALMLLDENGYLDCNNAAVQIFGARDKAQVCFRHPADLSPACQPCGTDSLILANRRIATAMKESSLRFEWMHKRLDTGELFPAEVLLSRMDLDDRPVLQASVRDVTKRKQLEQEYRTIVSTAMDGFWMVDKSGRFLDVNAAYCDLIGYSREELLNMRIQDVEAAESPEDTARHIERVMKITSDRFETQHRRKNGSIVHIEISTNFLPVQGGRFYVFLRDISERKRSQDALQKARAELELRVQERTAELVNANEALKAEIMERRRAEETLRESEDRFSSAFEHAPIGMALVTPDGCWSKVNRALCDLVGYSREELLARTFQDITHPDDLEADLAYVRQLLAGEIDAYQMEKRYLHKLGQDVPAMLSVSLIRNPRQTPLYFVSQIQGIAERKRADKEIREKEQRFRSITESSPMGMHIYRLESDGRLVLIGANPAATKILGIDHVTLLGKDIEDVFPGLIGTKVPGKYRLAAATGEPWQTQQISYEDHQITGAFDVYAFQISPGEMVAMFLDITERKQVEERLRLQSTALNAAANAIVITDRAGAIQWINPAWAKLTGYSAEEILGQNPRILKSGVQDEAFYRELWRSILAGQLWHSEITNRRKDGSLYTEDEMITPVLDASGQITHFIAIKQDITARKEAEEALRQSEEQLRQAQKMEAIGMLAGGVAHDFNNLLTAIIGYSDIVLATLGESNPLRPDVSEIKLAGERAAWLTRQLLAFSRKQILQPRVLDLNEVITGTEKMLRRLIGENIQLVTRPAPGLGQVNVDPGQIEQVLMNLAVNARDAMPEGGTLTMETANVDLDSVYACDHVAVKPGRYVMLAVSDTGCGMDAATQARIFEPFFTTKGLGKGTGLGLSTIYGIVKQSGGNIWVYSEPGHGSSFKVYLPRVEDSIGTVEEEDAAPETLSGSETILVAEDDKVIRTLTRSILEEKGYTVLEAGDGTEGIEVNQRHQGPIHLLISDVVMPGLSTRVFMPKITASRPNMKVLHISGYTDEMIVQHGVLEEGIHFIEKPFTPTALLRKVRQVLDG